MVRVSWQTSTEALSHPLGDSSLSGLERREIKLWLEMREQNGIRCDSRRVSGHLVDGERQFGSCSLADVDGAALCRVALHDGEDLQVTRGRRQVEVGQPGLFQVVEVSLSQSVPERSDVSSSSTTVHLDINEKSTHADRYLRALS